MEDTVNASIDDVEKVIREYADIDNPGSIYNYHIEKEEGGVFGTTLYFKQYGRSYRGLQTCGHAHLVRSDKNTKFWFSLNPHGIMKVCGDDFIQYEEEKQQLQFTFEDLNTKILEKFSKGEEPKGISDPKISERRARVKELSEKRVPITAIAIDVAASRSTVIRDRDELGFTTKRTKKRR